jgi:leucyl-tRNA synthetase
MNTSDIKGSTGNSSAQGGLEYKFREIEKKWQQSWKDSKTYSVPNESDKPKYYVLDMFPYPSGAGLHVGHPLGYIASDIFARYKRLKGFNVLHPMGYDAFGLPAEQYAIDHGVHPAVSTHANIINFRTQLDNIGFSFDWDREVKTSDPNYYKWTQWIFLQLFKSFYNRTTNKADSIDVLIAAFEKEGNISHPMPNAQYSFARFSAAEWKNLDEREQQDVLMQYRLAYCGVGEVNWCEALGTVLANDEVVNGVSERGGFPVIKKKLRQWYLRITEYADRLLEGLEKVDFSEAMKEMQTNWIGKSTGAEIDFEIALPLPSNGEQDAIEIKVSLDASANKHLKVLKEYGRTNRKNQEEAENILWQEIGNGQLGEPAERRYAIGGYPVDFAFLKSKLIVEIDGAYHTATEKDMYDTARIEYYKEFGFEVLTFSNEQVVKNTGEVINSITDFINKRKTNFIKDVSAPRFMRNNSDAEILKLKVYTTRPDTIFGVDFMVISPEHELVTRITTRDQKKTVDDYLTYVKSRSERERMAEKKITGVFTGAYALNPFDGREIPIWISEYVLAGYGTGAIMAVPCGDERDFKFAKHFNIPITNIIGAHFNGEEANPTKEAVLQNSGFLDGMIMKEALDVAVKTLEEKQLGIRKINFRMRDAAFSRQRYWGEPFPIIWKDGIAHPLDEADLPLELPEVESYKPGPEGEGPLANINEWTRPSSLGGGVRETNTMPGYAGSSWYFLRYMDPHNQQAFCDRKVSDYWAQVDLYIGGTEHAVGHLLYSRLWTKILFDLGHIGHDEPFKKLINQGMIQGSSRFVYRVRGTNTYVSHGIRDNYETDEIHVDVNFVDGIELNLNAFRSWREEYTEAEFILEDGRYICGILTEKMSKRLYNTVNPDDLVFKYGADTFRMYEMFLGPVEMSKPWDTKGIEGVHRFLKKLWRLLYDEIKGKVWTTEKATEAELKILHNTIRKIESDTERFSFNTGVSGFMIAVNELTDIGCHKKEILEQLLILLTPYAPHITEELWQQLGNTGSILDAPYPVFEAKYVAESSKEYPVSVNGKLRTTMNISLDASPAEVDSLVLQNEVIQKWLEGKAPKKIIFVKGKMVNVVI